MSAFLSVNAKVKLPAIFSDGMVVQRDRPVTVWGTADAGEKINISFNKKNYSVFASDNGKWRIELPSMKAGGPYLMRINDVVVDNILIGDVWLCSGQSNMELPVRRVTDKYASEIAAYENDKIRFVKLPCDNNLHGPQDDVSAPMKWNILDKKNALDCSALAYFYAIEMFEKTGIPVGIVNSSWGGSAVEAWMSEDALRKFPRCLNERDVFNSDSYRKTMNEAGGVMNSLWNLALYKGDEGLRNDTPWFSENLNDSDWTTINMFSGNWATENGYPLNGSHWFRQDINLTNEQASKDAILRMGCMVDADSVYVNGTFVGTIAYQYPPRIYNVPASILKEGKNNITVRLISYNGKPSFVADKLYCIVTGNDTINLSREWKYKTGCRMPSRFGGVSFQNIPTGMFNSMINPILNLKFKGAIWYQGETNTGRPNEYEALLSSMIDDWRSKFNDKNMPFVIVQLANFMQNHSYPIESGWAALREAQRQVSLKVPNTGLAVAIDLGEWNDIHPLNKKDLAHRVSLLTRKMSYGEKNIVSDGPVCKDAVIDNGNIVLTFLEGTDALIPNTELKGFSVSDSKGIYRWVKARTEGNKVVLECNSIKDPVNVRYGWDDNPTGINLINRSGLAASPFQVSVIR